MRRSSLVAALLLATSLTAPAFAAPVAAPAGSRVLVIPFLTLNLPSDKQWVGKAIQESLIADLGRTNNYSPIAFPGQVIVEDNATAARLAREVQGGAAAYAVRGSAQFVNNEIRLTAQLIDSRTGDTVATSIATGKADDLLKLEDDLANQLGSGPASSVPVYTTQGTGYVPRSNTVPANSNMNQPLNANTMYNPNYDYQDYSAPAYYYSPVYTPAYYDAYAPSYGYDYPYSYSYPFYPSIFFNSGFHRGFHHSGFSFGSHFGGHFGEGSHFGGGSFHGGGFGGGSFQGGGHISSMSTAGGFGGGHGGHR